MSRRFARLYDDGSFNVDSGAVNLEDARRRLGDSDDDDETEIVEVEITVIAHHGKKRLKVVKDDCIECPTCKEQIPLEGKKHA